MIDVSNQHYIAKIKHQHFCGDTKIILLGKSKSELTCYTLVNPNFVNHYYYCLYVNACIIKILKKLNESHLLYIILSAYMMLLLTILIQSTFTYSMCVSTTNFVYTPQ